MDEVTILILSGSHLLSRLDNQPQYKPSMMCCGAYPSIMFCHNAEPFLKRSLPVLRGHSFIQIVDDCQVRIVQGTRLFHDADAPVEISGVR